MWDGGGGGGRYHMSMATLLTNTDFCTVRRRLIGSSQPGFHVNDPDPGKEKHCC